MASSIDPGTSRVTYLTTLPTRIAEPSGATSPNAASTPLETGSFIMTTVLDTSRTSVVGGVPIPALEVDIGAEVAAGQRP